MTGEQVYTNFTAGKGTEPLQRISVELSKLRSTYADRAQSISEINTQMKSAWTGDASVAAHSGATPLVDALGDSARNMDHTTDSTASQSAAWEGASRSVEPVPPMPEKPNPWTTGLKAAIPVAGPFMAADDINSYQDGAQAHQRASQHNVDVMNSYTSQTGGNSGFPRSYSLLQPSSGSISLSDGSGPGGIDGRQSVAPDTTQASSSYVPGPAAVNSGGPVSAAPQVNSPISSSTVAPPTTGGTPNSVAPPPSVGTSGGNTGGGNTGPAGGGLVTGPGGNRDSNRPGANRTGPGASRGTGFTRTPTGPGRGLAGDRLRSVPDPKSAAAGRGGSGGTGGGGGGAGAGAGRAGEAVGRGGGAAAENARGLAAGKGTGAGMPGGVAAGESAAARGGASAARGAGGMPMGAAGAGRGKGSEDDEHQRAAYLQENDPDAVFIGDLGKTTPPVIGQ
nr:PPE domain-containing protein [Amycolatopsis marina]